MREALFLGGNAMKLERKETILKEDPVENPIRSGIRSKPSEVMQLQSPKMP